MDSVRASASADKTPIGPGAPGAAPTPTPEQARAAQIARWAELLRELKVQEEAAEATRAAIQEQVARLLGSAGR